MKTDPSPRLIVIVTHGVVQDIIADRPVGIVLVDHDSIQEGDPPEPYPARVDPAFIQAHWVRLCEGDLPDGL